MRILQVSTADSLGGAERIAWNLFEGYRRRGHSSWLAVGTKHRNDPDVVQIPRLDYRGLAGRLSLNLPPAKHDGMDLLSRIGAAAATMLSRPRHQLECRLGVENFEYPGTNQLLDLLPERPEIVHCHNLHGSYFDLRVLPRLSRQAPLVLTLHDAWLLSGHCAHSLDCERWRIGCGHCPDLTLYPAISRDATAYNWRRKKKIFSRTSVYISTPSQWLMEKVEKSLLRGGLAGQRVIPNGVDLAIFRPADKRSCRDALALPQDASVVMFAAKRPEANIWKDYNTFRAAIGSLARSVRRPIVFLCVGSERHSETIEGNVLLSIPFQTDPRIVARYYQAADLYVHASRADTFPCSVLEALGCGLPVVASNVGGIPEQVKGVSHLTTNVLASNSYMPDHATGVLVPVGDSEAMAACIAALLSNDTLLSQLSRNASKDARERFDLERQAESYLSWYKELLRAQPALSVGAKA